MATGWERLAVFEGGSVMDLARAQAADGSWHVFAATAVGVFRSTDRGRSWAPLGTGSRVAGAEVVVASPRYAEDGLVYAGAHDGVYRYQGDGPSWQRILTDCYVQDIELHTGDADAHTDGSGLTVFVGTQKDGILVSRNGGRTWDGSNVGLSALCAFDLALSPSFSEDGIAFAAMSDGLYRTRNGGEAWRQLDTDTEDDLFDAVALSPTFSEDRLVLAASFEHGLFRSDDGGRSWTPTANLGVQFLFGLELWSSERAVAWTESGAFLSDDGGQTWELSDGMEATEDVGGASDGVLLPASDDAAEVILAALRENDLSTPGIVRSLDGGQTWEASASGLHAALISNLLLSPDFTGEPLLYATSLGDALQLSRDGGRTWTTVETSEEVLAPDDSDPGDDLPSDGEPFRRPGSSIGALAVIAGPDGGRRLIGSAQYDLFLSDDDGETWERAWEETPITSDELSWESIRFVATAATPTGAHILADIKAGTMTWYLVGSRDGGLTWTELDTPNKDAFVYGLALTPDAGLDGPIYVAVNNDWDGNFTLWRSPDGGKRWQVWYEDAEAKSAVTKPFVALPTNPWDDTVVLAFGNQILRPRPNAWAVVGGARQPVWDSVLLADEELPGRPASIAGLTVSPDYARDRTLFAATSAGVYVSRDGGASFTQWNDGLEPVATVAVAISPAYAEDRLVYGLGLGGTIWRREDR